MKCWPHWLNCKNKVGRHSVAAPSLNAFPRRGGHRVPPLLLLDRRNRHLAGVIDHGKVDVIVNGETVQQRDLGHSKFHLHRRHQALDIVMIDQDRGQLRI